MPKKMKNDDKKKDESVSKKMKQEKQEEIQQIKKISFDCALGRFKKQNPEKAFFMKDVEAIKLFIEKFIPSLEASQEEFNKVLDRY